MTPRLSGQDLDALSHQVIGAAIEVHRHLGPGLLERAYVECLTAELRESGILVATELTLPLRYKNVVIDNAYRLDLLIEDELIVEVKAVEQLLPVHTAQLLTYLKMRSARLGLLMNFNHEVMRQGVKRVVNGL